MKYEVGQVLWLVPPHNTRQLGYVVKVTHVGRKWAKLDVRGYRVEVGKTSVDGGKYSSPGRVWPSQEAYNEQVLLEREWRYLASKIWYGAVPDGITRETVNQVFDLLRLTREPTT